MNWLSARFTIRRGNALRSICILMLAAIAVVFMRSVFIYSLDPWVHWYDTPPDFWRDVMPTSIQNNILIINGVNYTAEHNRIIAA